MVDKIFSNFVKSTFQYIGHTFQMVLLKIFVDLNEGLINVTIVGDIHLDQMESLFIDYQLSQLFGSFAIDVDDSREDNTSLSVEMLSQLKANTGITSSNQNSLICR